MFIRTAGMFKLIAGATGPNLAERQLCNEGGFPTVTVLAKRIVSF
jgi:hypothetical protein